MGDMNSLNPGRGASVERLENEGKKFMPKPVKLIARKTSQSFAAFWLKKKNDKYFYNK